MSLAPSSPRRLPTELTVAPPNAWDAAALTILAAILLVAAAAFGGVEPWCELTLFALAAGLGGLLIARGLRQPDFRPPGFAALAPAALWVGLGLLQATPLPQRAVRGLAPGVAAARDAAEQAPASTSPPTNQARTTTPADAASSLAPAPPTLSVEPHATRHAWRLALLALTVLVAVVTLARSPTMIKRLLAVGLAVGVAEAGLAVAQLFGEAKAIYWTYPVGGLVTSGSFVNYSNFAQFVNLAVGCGAALLLVSLHVERGRHASMRSAAFGLDGERFALLAAATTLCAAAVFTSLSRNGALSLVVASAVIGLALFAEGTLSRRGWLLAAVVLAALAALLVFAFDALVVRFEQGLARGAVDDRWELTKAALAAWRASPWLGWGLGTHAAAFPQFDPTPAAVLAQHADNDYAQLVEETGLAGAAVAATFVALIAAAAGRAMRRGQTPISFASFGLSLGLIAVTIHSATDFGLRLPAGGCLAAFCCGLVVAVDRWERLVARGESPPSPARSAGSGRRRAALLVAALAIGAGAWGVALADAYRAWLADGWRRAAIVLDADAADPEQPDPWQCLVDAVAAAEQALEADPQDPQLRYEANLRRWNLLQAYLADLPPEEPLDGATLDQVRRLADDLRAARLRGPTRGAAWSLEGQIRRYLLDDSQGEELIARGLLLAPYDPATTLIAARLAAQHGDEAQAQRLLRRSVQLDARVFPDVATVLLDELDRPAWARELAGDDYGRLRTLATLAQQSPEHAALARQWDEESIELLRRRVTADEATPGELAALAAVDAGRGESDTAAELYRRALAAQYGRVDWRIALARTLIAAEKFPEAERELRICLQLRPGDPTITKLLEEVSVQIPAPP